jgi:hypothetical protein
MRITIYLKPHLLPGESYDAAYHRCGDFLYVDYLDAPGPTVTKALEQARAEFDAGWSSDRWAKRGNKWRADIQDRLVPRDPEERKHEYQHRPMRAGDIAHVDMPDGHECFIYDPPGWKFHSKFVPMEAIHRGSEVDVTRVSTAGTPWPTLGEGQAWPCISTPPARRQWEALKHQKKT